MNSYYPIVKAELLKLGFTLLRQGKGSHEIYIRDKTKITLPHSLRTRPLANSILKEAGSSKRV
jgi:predicted RNA binding protein YcfA (HicA-like mRNA interferase family)